MSPNAVRGKRNGGWRLPKNLAVLVTCNRDVPMNVIRSAVDCRLDQFKARAARMSSLVADMNDTARQIIAGGPQLARERHPGCLALFDLSAGEFPFERVPSAGFPLADQNFPVVLQNTDGNSCHFDQIYRTEQIFPTLFPLTPRFCFSWFRRQISYILSSPF